MDVTQSRRKAREQGLTDLFAEANDALLTPLQDQLRSHGLSIVDWRVLKTLLAEDGVRIIDIANHALSHKVTITQAVGRMERSGVATEGPERRSPLAACLPYGTWSPPRAAARGAGPPARAGRLPGAGRDREPEA